MSQDASLTRSECLIRYRKSINLSFELFLFNLWQLLQVAAYAQKDAEKKNAKLMPSEADMKFTARLYENPLVQSILLHQQFLGLVSTFEFKEKTDIDIIRRLYYDFAKTDIYLRYLDNTEASTEDHRQVLLQLYKFCISEELFTDKIEDFYPTWTDDRSLIIGSMKKALKALPADAEYLTAYRPTEETTKDFGEYLLTSVLDKDQEYLDIIEPTLKNWDADRVAIIDMILLKMALAELMGFPTIPTKVTLNEFVEISKLYSTDKSKDFINGILDRLLKKLDKDGKINKEGRGLIE
ncbi:MAG: transcription antitermination factor NusB [Phaeodactylibacter sp.]|nr:transcription antitermination factor NusB [Phaeodactylibacter sp.]